jgi:two-component system, chemotaxis family, chemotaxis protein CheY
MRILIVEDDMTSRLLLRKMLEPFGSCDIAVNGKEAVEAFRLASKQAEHYALVCLDIMMPEMDGQAALKAIRALEQEAGCLPSQAAKIVMTTALRDIENVTSAYRELCDGYLVKPIMRDKLVPLLKELALLPLNESHLTA